MAVLSVADQRLQALISGAVSAGDYVQEVVTDALQQLVVLVSSELDIPLTSLTPLKDRVAEAAAFTAARPVDKARVQCRAKTKARKRCKSKACVGTEFCGRHNKQRDAFYLQLAVTDRLVKHDAKVRARAAKGHTHRWNDEDGFQAGCAVCDKLQPAAHAVSCSFSGQSMRSTCNGEEVSS